VAEQAVFSWLQRKGFSCTVISEEKGVSRLEGKNVDGYLIVDALDGTNNAVRGVPFSCVSLAAAEKPWLSSVYVGVVQDLWRDECFWAARGGGAFLNRREIHPSANVSLRTALLGVDVNPPIPNRWVNGLIRLLRSAKHSRHLGANALELCYVACGRLEAFVELRGRSRVTDIAACQLILREAGGFLVDEWGQPLEAPLDPSRQRLSFIASGNREILNRILRLLGIPAG
ncbi:fructose 1,6-bisphosphatase, partial [Candidatus Bathyarchaeota archaeon]